MAGNISAASRALELTIDTTPSVVTASLAKDTAPGGATNSDRITNDATIVGSVTAGSSLRAGFNDTPVASYVDVTGNLAADGSFTFSRNQLEQIKGTPLLDGVYTLHLNAADKAGNVSSVKDLAFTLDTTAPASPGFMLAPTSDTGAVGDAQTTSATVTLTGQSEPNITLLQPETGITTTSNASAQYRTNLGSIDWLRLAV